MNLNQLEVLVAIVDTGSLTEAGERIDAKSCLDYFAANFGCGVCIDVCPFSQMGYDVIKERFKGNPNAPHFSIPMKIELEERGRLQLPQV
jgi:hypothetical protein